MKRDHFPAPTRGLTDVEDEPSAPPPEMFEEERGTPLLIVLYIVALLATLLASHLFATGALKPWW